MAVVPALRGLTELLALPAVPGLRELPVPPELPGPLEQQVLAPLPEPRALPEQARLAQRLALAALPERRALDERPSAHASQAALRGGWAAPACRSHPPIRRRRSDRISRESLGDQDRGLECCGFHKPVARE